MATESAKAADAYAAYRDLGPSRSLAKVIDSGKSTVNIRQLERWCSEHQWVQRAKDWDEEQREAERQKKQKAIEEMNARHAQIGVSLQAKTIKQIEALIAAQKFGSQATVMALKLATDLERIARGQPTEHTEVTGKDGGPIEVTAVRDRILGRIAGYAARAGTLRVLPEPDATGTE